MRTLALVLLLPLLVLVGCGDSDDFDFQDGGQQAGLSPEMQDRIQTVQDQIEETRTRFRIQEDGTPLEVIEFGDGMDAVFRYVDHPDRGQFEFWMRMNDVGEHFTVNAILHHGRADCDDQWGLVTGVNTEHIGPVQPVENGAGEWHETLDHSLDELRGNARIMFNAVGRQIGCVAFE